MRRLLIGIVLGVLLASGAAWAYSGIWLQAVRIDSDNQGMALWDSSTLPTNPSGSVPFALSIKGDMTVGDVYCIHTGGSGCVYGRAYQTPTGASIYQSNSVINGASGTGGPGFILWPDVSNIDGSGNRGYADIWAWGQNDSAFSNTLNFGNRDSGGNPHRRFRILNDGSLNLPDLAGTGTVRLCIDSSGTLVREGC